MVLGRSTVVLGTSTMVSDLVGSGLVWSGLVRPEYYSISAADMFVLVHSNFDHNYNYYYYYYYYRVLSARSHVEASLRDGLISSIW